jgi:hypothetical protein
VGGEVYNRSNKCAATIVLATQPSLNSVNQLIFVMVKCGVLFEVRTGFLNIIYKSCGFKCVKYNLLVLFLNC